MSYKANKSEQKILDQLHIGTESETVKNPFSGESTVLEPTAVAVYDYLRGSESMRMTNTSDFRRMLSFFRKNWGSEYMVLLD